MNKKILTIAIAICTLFTSVQIGFSKTTISTTVINAGSGGTYRLSKNTVVTIKMDEGDKLFVYEKGKKGAMLLVASSEMDGKVQLVSKL